MDVGVDDTVIGATIHATGLLLVKATRVGSETTLAQIVSAYEQVTPQVRVQKDEYSLLTTARGRSL